MKASKAGRMFINLIDSVINLTVLIAITLLIAYASYALWDSNRVHWQADKSQYTVYKPAAESEGKSFKELQALNDEVIAWLTVYGTHIDYPVTQGKNNMKYVSTDAEGQYSLSGAIFLDSENDRRFNDFNSVFHGHHMAKKAMFSEIGKFTDRAMFESRRYGNLYFDEKDHGIEFVAFLHADAYDTSVYSPGVSESSRQAYIDNLLAKATHIRNTDISITDHLVLLSTCSTDSTNGRDILVGRLTGGIYEDTFENEESNAPMIVWSGVMRSADLFTIRLALILALALLILIILIFKRKKKKRYQQ